MNCIRNRKKFLICSILTALDHSLICIFPEIIAVRFLPMYDKNSASDFEARNRSILFAFTTDRVLDTFMPNHFIARSAQNEFFDEIRRRNIGLYESISRSGAFSMYLLCKRSGDGRYIGIGKVFAGVVRRPEDEKAEKTGEELYQKYFNYCIEHIKNVEFAF